MSRAGDALVHAAGRGVPDLRHGQRRNEDVVDEDEDEDEDDDDDDEEEQ